jgi:hypothetical protein
VSREIFVSGEPVIFLGGNRERETAWVTAIRSAMGAPLTHPRLRFVVGSLTRGGNPFDIDNLAKLVLDNVAPQASSVWIDVSEGKPPGVRISYQTPPIPPAGALTVPIAAPLSRSVKPHVEVPELRGLPVYGEPNSAVGLSLAFDSDAAAIGGFGFTGPIKPLIDSLEPLLGRYRSGPRDHRIRELRITRSARPMEFGVTVSLWSVP